MTMMTMTNGDDDDSKAGPSFHKLFLPSLQLPTLSYTSQLLYTHAYYTFHLRVLVVSVV